MRDVSDAGALGDALANLKYTIDTLKSDAADWEAFEAYGERHSRVGGAA